MNRDDILPLLRWVYGEPPNDSFPLCHNPAWLAYHEVQKQRYEGVRETIRRMDDAELFYGLFPLTVTAMTFDSNPAAGYSVSLLRELNPTCQISCEQAIRAMLSDWDISTEEVPFYIYRQFGKATVDEAIKNIGANPLTEKQRAQLETVKYWTDIAANSDSATKTNFKSPWLFSCGSVGALCLVLLGSMIDKAARRKPQRTNASSTNGH